MANGDGGGGEISRAAAPLTAPRQGSTINDLIGMGAALAKEREAQRRLRNQEALAQAMLDLETRKIEVEESGAALAAEQLEEERRQHDDNLGVAMGNVDAQERIARAQEINAQVNADTLFQSKEEKDAAEAAAGEVLRIKHRYRPEQIVKGGALRELEHLNALELERLRGQSFSSGEVLKAHAAIYDAAVSRMDQAEEIWRDRRDKATVFIEGVQANPVLPDGRVLDEGEVASLTATLTMTPEERMAVIQRFEQAGLSLGVLAEFDRVDRAIVEERRRFDDASAKYFSDVAPILPGGVGAVGLSEQGGQARGSGVGSPDPEQRRVAIRGLEQMAQSPSEFYQFWGVSDNAEPKGPDGLPLGGIFAVDEVVNTLGYASREDYVAKVIQPAEQAQAAMAQGQSTLPFPAKPFTEYSSGRAGDLGSGPGRAPAPPDPLSTTPQAAQARVRDWEIVKQGGRGKLKGEGSISVPGRVLISAQNLIRMGVPRHEVLSWLLKDERLHNFVAQRTQDRVGGGGG